MVALVACADFGHAAVQAKRRPAPQGAKVAPAPAKALSVKLPGTTVTLEMVRVPAGAVTVADPRKKGAKTKVAVKGFWMARTETVWDAYDPFVFGLDTSGPTPLPAGVDAVARPSKPYIPPDLGWGHTGFPVINVTHHAATQYCVWLSALTGRKFRLATEAEWEWACRAGAATPFAPKGAALDAVAWHLGNSGGQTRAVAGKKPNALGLVDMLGNAGEWTNDLAGKPVLCGGSWADKADMVSSAGREYQSPDWTATDPQMPKSKWWLSDGSFAGFRVVCE